VCFDVTKLLDFSTSSGGLLNAGAKLKRLAILVVTLFFETSIVVADDTPERVFYNARIWSRPEFG
jgi:hypothetical protein